MKRLLIAAAFAAILALLVAGYLWSPFAPSIVVIRNVGDRPVALVLVDAEPDATVWSGTLRPGGRKTVVVWFKYEGGPEIRCDDGRERRSETIPAYITPHTAIRANIAVDDCAGIVITAKNGLV